MTQMAQIPRYTDTQTLETPLLPEGKTLSLLSRYLFALVKCKYRFNSCQAQERARAAHVCQHHPLDRGVRWSPPHPAVESHWVKAWSRIRRASSFLPNRSGCSSSDLLILGIKYVSYYILPLLAQCRHRSSDFRAGAASLPVTVSHQQDELRLLFTPRAQGELAKLPVRKQASKEKKKIPKKKERI